MMHRMKTLVLAIRDSFSRNAAKLRGVTVTAASAGAQHTLNGIGRAKRTLIVLGVAGATGYLLYSHFPLKNVERGEVGIRLNQLTGNVTEFRDGRVLVVPGFHDLRVYSLRDKTYKPAEAASANGPAPVQSVEGLSLGVDLAIRYAIDPTKLAAMSKTMPDDVGAEIVAPAVHGVIYKTFARYTAREIFSTKRPEIQQTIEKELAAKLAADGVILRSVQVGKVDLPSEYKRGMETLLSEELASEKMRYTLDLKEKRVKETQLEGEAEKARREKAAEAAAREQIIAAKAQEEAMKHILPLRERQIQQRKLEAEATNVERVKGAEGNAQARRIEAMGEADARQKLADAEAYRVERVGKAGAEQMSREGALITKHPLLIQKTLADKLSDKIQVIIAPPPADGGFIGQTLVGGPKRDTRVAEAREDDAEVAANEPKGRN